MVSKNKQILGLIVIVLAVFILITAFTGLTDVGSIIDQKGRVICRVKVDADVFSELDFEEASCHLEGKCFFNLATSNPLSLTGNVGTVVYSTSDGAKGTSKVDLSGLSDKVYSEVLCTDSGTVHLRLLNEVKEEVDSLEVDIQ